MLFPGECGENKIKIAVALPLFVLDHSLQKTGQNKIILTEKKIIYKIKLQSMNVLSTDRHVFSLFMCVL